MSDDFAMQLFMNNMLKGGGGGDTSSGGSSGSGNVFSQQIRGIFGDDLGAWLKGREMNMQVTFGKTFAEFGKAMQGFISQVELSFVSAGFTPPPGVFSGKIAGLLSGKQ